MPGSLSRFFKAVALAALFVSVTWTTRASAVTVAILGTGTTPALSEVAFRLRGELSALRVEVVLLTRPPALPRALDTRAWLEQAADERELDAALEVIAEPTGPAVDVWVFQRSPRRAQVARVVVEPDTADRAGTLAIRAIEVLRSYDLEASLAHQARPRAGSEPPPRAEVTPPPDGRDSGAAATRPERAERLGLELGAGVLTGLDGVGPALLPVMRVDWRAWPSWVVHATLSGLGTRPTLRAPAGTVRVAQSYAAVGVCYCPASGRRLAPYLALAAGATHAALEGAAVAPARGHAVERWSLLLDVGAGARFALPGGYYTTLSGHIQLAQPHVVINVLDDQVGSIGRPGLIGNLMVGTWL